MEDLGDDGRGVEDGTGGDPSDPDVHALVPEPGLPLPLVVSEEAEVVVRGVRERPVDHVLGLERDDIVGLARLDAPEVVVAIPEKDEVAWEASGVRRTVVEELHEVAHGSHIRHPRGELVVDLLGRHHERA